MNKNSSDALHIPSAPLNWNYSGMKKVNAGKLIWFRIAALVFALGGVLYLSSYLKSDQAHSKASVMGELFAPNETRTIDLKSWSKPEQSKNQSPPLTKTTQNH